MSRISSKFNRIIQNLARFVKLFILRFNEENVLTISSGIAFNILLCLIPFMVVLTSLFGIFLQSSYANKHVDDLLGSILPSQPYTAEIKNFIYKLFFDIVRNRHRFGIFGLGTLLWTAASLFGSIRRILNKIYHLKGSKNILRKSIENILLVIILGLLFLTANVFTWVLRAAESFVSELSPGSMFDIKVISKSFPLITSYLAALTMFYIINRYMPDKKIPPKIAFAASLTTTSLWWVAGKLFAWYVATFHPFSQVYGTYTFLFVFLVWIYYSSMVFVVGLVFGQVYQERSIPDPFKRMDKQVHN
jgi:membrane protein